MVQDTRMHAHSHIQWIQTRVHAKVLSRLESIRIAITPPCLSHRPPLSCLVSNFGRRDNSDDNDYIVVRLVGNTTRSCIVLYPVIVGSDV